jgi:hypothetical protein
VLAKRRKLGIAAGTWQPFVDAAPAIAHIADLRTNYRMSVDAIAEAAGLGYATVSRLAYPDTGVPIQWGIRPRVEQAILRTTILDAPDQAWVAAFGAARRLQALAAIGWPDATLALEVGVTRQCIRHWRETPHLAARNLRRVVALYDDLSMTPGPSDWWRRRAAEQGWAPPLAWDDETIDDPQAGPQLGGPSVGVDDAVVARVLAGEPESTTAAERVVLVPLLHARGLNDSEAAALLGVWPETVLRIRRRLRVGGRYAA